MTSSYFTDGNDIENTGVWSHAYDSSAMSIFPPRVRCSCIDSQPGCSTGGDVFFLYGRIAISEEIIVMYHQNHTQPNLSVKLKCKMSLSWIMDVFFDEIKCSSTADFYFVQVNHAVSLYVV